MAGDIALALDSRQTLSFDRDWRFHLGDVPGGEKPEFDASAWRSLDVPHDWSIEGPAGPDPKTMDGPFDSKSPGGPEGGALNGGIGWYRKTFPLPAAPAGSGCPCEFDGVYMDSDVWINGQHLGNHPYGYTSFAVRPDPAPQARIRKTSLAVRVERPCSPCSRWYSRRRHLPARLADLNRPGPRAPLGEFT